VSSLTDRLAAARRANPPAPESPDPATAQPSAQPSAQPTGAPRPAGHPATPAVPPASTTASGTSGTPAPPTPRTSAGRAAPPTGSGAFDGGLSTRRAGQANDRIEELKSNVHVELLKQLGPQLYDSDMDQFELDTRVRAVLAETLMAQERPLSSSDRARVTQEISDDILGYGPIEPYLRDPDVSEVMVNGHNSIWLEKSGRLVPASATFTDEAHLRRTIDKIVSRIGRRVDESSPMVDARLPDGSRVNAVVPPLAVDGSALTIRKFATDPLTVADLIRFGSLNNTTAAFLDACVRGRLNVIVSGGTGSGKTTTLNVLSSFIPSDERIVTIEDAAELQLKQDHVVRLESRPANIEGKGAVTIRDLVKNSLRMRPDRIIVGEVHRPRRLYLHAALQQPARHAVAHGDHGADGRHGPTDPGHPRTGRLGGRPRRPPVPLQGRRPTDHPHHRGRADGGRRHHNAGHLRLRQQGRLRRGRPQPGPDALDRSPTELPREDGVLQRDGRPDALRPGHLLMDDHDSARSPHLARAARVLRALGSSFGSLSGVLLVGALLTGSVLSGSAATATGSGAGGTGGTGSIAHVETGPDGLQILVTVPSVTDLDLSSPVVMIDGVRADATATVVDGATPVRRTTVLVIDTSNSMQGARFEAAQSAARGFIRLVPDDVYVAIVGFAAEVSTLLAPSQDRAQALQVVSDLTLGPGTSLYAGVIAAAQVAGDTGQRNLIVLSDGADTTDTVLADAVAAVKDNDLIVDAVAVDQGGVSVPGLAELAAAGNGRVIPADPAALRQAFDDEARSLANQVLVTAVVPAAVVEAGTTESNVEVVLAGVAGAVTAEAFSSLVGASTPTSNDVAAPTAEAARTLGAWAKYAGPVVLGVGLLAVLALLVPFTPLPLTPEQRITHYAVWGRVGSGRGGPRVETEEKLNQVRDAAADLLRRNKSFEARISKRLEAAGSELRASEWLLIHGGVFVLAGLLGLLLGRGNLVIGLLCLLAGVFVPWVYLGLRAGRRRKAFHQGLPDTLQLMSGSLSAGLSLAQSVDTIVREGPEPIAGQFKRVLIETRLGVPLEDAMDGIAERFESKDFEWVVMAIRIQRQVGGNLAELLGTVAATMREREYIRRQVAALAAEGKLSAWVLGLLPVMFLLYLLVANRTYVMVLFTEPLGWLMLGGASLLLAVGVFWMSRLIKVEV